MYRYEPDTSHVPPRKITVLEVRHREAASKSAVPRSLQFHGGSGSCASACHGATCCWASLLGSLCCSAIHLTMSVRGHDVRSTLKKILLNHGGVFLLYPLGIAIYPAALASVSGLSKCCPSINWSQVKLRPAPITQLDLPGRTMTIIRPQRNVAASWQ